MVTTNKTTMIITIKMVLSLSGSPPRGTGEEAEIIKNYSTHAKTIFISIHFSHHRFAMSVIMCSFYIVLGIVKNITWLSL